MTLLQVSRLSTIYFLLIFFTSITLSAQCIVINELMVDGPGDADDDLTSAYTQEWVELYNTCDTPQDISCYNLCDGDFCVTIPDGTPPLPAFGYFVIGSDSSVYNFEGTTGYLAPEGLLDLNWATCGCTYQIPESTATNEVGAFRNNAEQVVLFDNSAAISDAIAWGGGQRPYGLDGIEGSGSFPQTINLPTMMGCGAQAVQIPNPLFAAAYEIVGTSCQGCVVRRTCDGLTNAWISTAVDATPGSGIKDRLEVNFSASALDVCLNGTIELTDLSDYLDPAFMGTGSAGWTYLWEISAPGVYFTFDVANPVGVGFPLAFDYDIQLTVTNESGCSYSLLATDFIHVFQPSAFFTIPSTEVCVGENVQFTNSSPTADTFDWNIVNTTTGEVFTSNVQTPDFTFMTAGVYDVTLTVNCGVVRSVAAYFTVLESPTVTAMADVLNICSGETSMLTAMGGDTYEWRNGAGMLLGTDSFLEVSPISNALYTVEGFNAQGCGATASLFIMVSPSPAITPVETDINICAGETVTLEVIDEGYSYVWTGDNLISNNGISVTANPTSDAVYTATTTESCPGEALINVSVTVTPPPSIVSPFPICDGESGVISATGSGIVWYNSAETVIGAGSNFDPLSVAGLVTLGTPTTIYVSQMVAGCRSELLPVNLEILADTPPDASTISPVTLCANDASGLDLMTLVTGDTGGTWTTNAPAGTIIDNVFLTDAISGGNYAITYTVAGVGNCSNASTTQSLLVIEPVVNFTSDIQTLCTGEAVSFNNLSIFANNSYFWIFSSDDAGVFITSTQSDPEIVFDVPGLYDVELTIGCDMVELKNDFIDVRANPDIELTPPTEICLGENATLTATIAGFTGTLNWTDETGASIGTSNTITVSPSETTLYTVEAIDNTGCSSTAQTTVSIANAAVAIFPSEATICAGASVILTATGADSYTWSPAEGLSSTEGAVVTANPSVNTVYTLTAQEGDCTMTQTVSVSITSDLSIELVPSQPYVCEAGETIDLQAFGGSDYTWMPHTTLSGSGSTVQISPTATTTYTVNGTDVTGCAGANSIEIGINDLTISAGNTLFICENSDVELNGTASSSFSTNLTYAWSPVETLSDANIANPIANPTTTTIYTLTVTDEYGCQKTDQVTVNVLEQPALTVSATSVCAGEEVTLSINSLTVEDIEWSPIDDIVATVSDFTVLAYPTTTTTYCIAGVYSNDCLLNACVTVEVVDATDLNVTATTTELCQNGTAVLTASGAAQYAWWPPDGLSSITGAVVEASPTVTTTYTIQGVDALGCTNSNQEITIEVNGLIAPEFTATPDDMTLCEGSGSVELSVATNGDNVFWSPTQGLLPSIGETVMANPSQTTTYIATATNMAGCETSTAVTIEVSETVSDLVVPITEALICTNQDSLMVSISGSADTYTWSPAEGLSTTSGTEVNMFPTNPTVYTITADYGDCVSVAQIETDVAFAPEVTVIEDQAICNGDMVMLTAEGGTLYGWTPTMGLDNPLAANPIANPTQTTTYTVNVVDQDSGCEITEEVVVEVSDGPEVFAGEAVSVCADMPYDITDATATAVTSLSWTGGAGTFSMPNELNPSYTPEASEVGSVLLFLEATDDCGTAQDTLELMVGNDIGTIDAGADLSFCEIDSVALSGTASAEGTYTWTGGNGIFTDPTALTTQYIPATDELGILSLILQAENGCGMTADTMTVEIQGAGLASIEVAQEEFTLFAGETANIMVDGAEAYEWSPAEGLNCTDCPNPVANPLISTTYTVEDVSGCLDAATVTVNILENKLLLFPNAFSPNNDGKNDELRVLDRGLEYFTLRIFGRWGEQIFQTSDPNMGWDGTFKGEPQPVGVYSYVIDYKFIEDRRPKLKSGNITLIR